MNQVHYLEMYCDILLKVIPCLSSNNARILALSSFPAREEERKHEVAGGVKQPSTNQIKAAGNCNAAK